MAGRPRRDGTPARAVNKRKLTDLFVTSRKAQARHELIWDERSPGWRCRSGRPARRRGR